MLAILINPDQQSKTIIELSNDPPAQQRSIRELLNCEVVKHMPNEDQSLNLIVDLSCFASKNLGMRIPGLSYPLFGNVLLTGWNKKTQQPVSIPEGIYPSSVPIVFLNAKETQEEREIYLEVMREVFDEWAKSN